MNRFLYSVYIAGIVLIIFAVTVYLAWYGFDFYRTPIEERFYHPQYKWFQPAGIFGHGLGVIGTLLILFGVVIYIAAKRYNFLIKYIRLKYILEFHIFLCIIGPILILFHTAFKFGGLVSVAFWSMVAVVLSGVAGRFIYIRIPRTVDGRELDMGEILKIRADMITTLRDQFGIDEDFLHNLQEATATTRQSPDRVTNQRRYSRQKILNLLNKKLEQQNTPEKRRVAILKAVKKEISLSQKIAHLGTMKKLFRYWHVAHMPFALIMLIIVIIHVGITLALGYKWIF